MKLREMRDLTVRGLDPKRTKLETGIMPIPDNTTADMNILKLMRIKGIKKIEVYATHYTDDDDYGDGRNEDLELAVEIINRHLADRDIHAAQEELIDSRLKRWANI